MASIASGPAEGPGAPPDTLEELAEELDAWITDVEPAHLGASFDYIHSRYALDAVHISALSADPDYLKLVLADAPESVNSADSFGRTPLTYCALIGDHHKCELLISLGADIDSFDTFGRTPCHYAALYGHSHTLETLILQGAQFWELDGSGLATIHICATLDSSVPLDMMLKVLKNFDGTLEFVNQQDATGRTAVHWAADHGRFENLHTLAMYGASLEETDNEGSTPLHLGVCDVACTEFLLHNGYDDAADLNALDAEQCTALLHAVMEQNVEVTETLLEMPSIDVNVCDPQGRTSLHWAFANNNTTLARALLASSARFDLLDLEGLSPLHYATMYGYEECVELLTQHDFKCLYVTDSSGRSALMQAAATEASLKALGVMVCAIEEEDRDHHDNTGESDGDGGEESIAQHMWEHTDDDGRTIMHYVAFAGNADAVPLMRSVNVDVNVADTDGSTPLMLACEQGHTSVLKAMHDVGFSVRLDMADMEGKNALHKAAIAGHAACVAQLLEMGARASSVDERGETAVHYAAFYGHVDVLEELLGAGIDPASLESENTHKQDLMNQKDLDGITALHWAARQGHSDSVRMLCEHGAYPNFPDHGDTRGTPLDYASPNQQACIAVLREFGAVEGRQVLDFAATVLQAHVRGRRDRKRCAALRAQRALDHRAERDESAASAGPSTTGDGGDTVNGSTAGETEAATTDNDGEAVAEVTEEGEAEDTADNYIEIDAGDAAGAVDDVLKPDAVVQGNLADEDASSESDVSVTVDTTDVSPVPKDAGAGESPRTETQTSDTGADETIVEKDMGGDVGSEPDAIDPDVQASTDETAHDEDDAAAEARKQEEREEARRLVIERVREARLREKKRAAAKAKSLWMQPIVEQHLKPQNGVTTTHERRGARQPSTDSSSTSPGMSPTENGASDTNGDQRPHRIDVLMRHLARQSSQHKEMQRLANLRRKVYAAVVIQRAVRRWNRTKAMRRRQAEERRATKQASSSYKRAAWPVLRTASARDARNSAALPVEMMADEREDKAARVIQHAWWRYTAQRSVDHDAHRRVSHKNTSRRTRGSRDYDDVIETTIPLHHRKTGTTTRTIGVRREVTTGLPPVSQQSYINALGTFKGARGQRPASAKGHRPTSAKNQRPASARSVRGGGDRRPHSGGLKRRSLSRTSLETRPPWVDITTKDYR